MDIPSKRFPLKQRATQNSRDDVVILHCDPCGWVSPELTVEEFWGLGYPNYCHWCGSAQPHYTRFNPSERSIISPVLLQQAKTGAKQYAPTS